MLFIFFYYGRSILLFPFSLTRSRNGYYHSAAHCCTLIILHLSRCCVTFAPLLRLTCCSISRSHCFSLRVPFCGDVCPATHSITRHLPRRKRRGRGDSSFCRICSTHFTHLWRTCVDILIRDAFVVFACSCLLYTLILLNSSPRHLSAAEPPRCCGIIL